MKAGESMGNGRLSAVQRPGHRFCVPGLLRGPMEMKQNFELLDRVDALKKKAADTLRNVGSHC
jgi:hypothetical protein